MDKNQPQPVQLPQVGQQLTYPLDYVTQQIIGQAVNDYITANPTGGSLPVGTIVEYPVDSAPPGRYLLADGSNVSRTTYAALFAVYGTTHGTGDGSTTFGIPNRAGVIGVGKNGATFATIGGTGGEETHTLSVNEMPAHTHDVETGGLNSGVNKPQSVSNSSGGTNTSNTALTKGGGLAHNNLQPYQVSKYYIVY